MWFASVIKLFFIFYFGFSEIMFKNEIEIVLYIVFRIFIYVRIDKSLKDLKPRNFFKNSKLLY